MLVRQSDFVTTLNKPNNNKKNKKKRVLTKPVAD